MDTHRETQAQRHRHQEDKHARARALGQFFAQAAAMDLTMDAFVLKRSSRDIPGLRGTPAGITTMFAPGWVRAGGRAHGRVCVLRGEERY